MYLTLACQGLEFEQIIGNKSSHKMWTALKDQYEPSEVDDYLELTEKFMNCKIASKHENPEIWFQKLEHIRSRMGSIDPIYTKNDLEIKAFILTKLPKDYS